MREQYEKFVGKNASVSFHGFILDVVVSDYKESYGKKRWLITPQNGSGSVWVEHEPVVA